jgi:hypothetical protein
MLLYFKNQNTPYLILFTVVSIVSALNRQIGLVFPLIFGIILLYISKRTFKDMMIAVLPFLLTYAAVFTYETTARNSGIIPVNYSLQINNIINTILHPSGSAMARIAYYFITSTVCLGLMMIPLVVSNMRSHIRDLRFSKKAKALLILYLVIVSAKTFFTGHPLPFVGNIFHRFGIGPIIMTGFDTDTDVPLSAIETSVYSIFSLAGAFVFSLSVFVIIKKSGSDKKNISGLFIILLFVFYLLPLCFSYANDRYLIVLLPFFFFAYVNSGYLQFNIIKFGLYFTLILSISVICTSDYLNVHKAKYQASSHLLNDLKISPQSIDGGFEFNGWYLGDPVKNYDPEHKGRWWWIDKDDYIVSPVKFENYFVESEYETGTLFLPGIDKIYVLRKN